MSCTAFQADEHRTTAQQRCSQTASRRALKRLVGSTVGHYSFQSFQGIFSYIAFFHLKASRRRQQSATPLLKKETHRTLRSLSFTCTIVSQVKHSFVSQVVSKKMHCAGIVKVLFPVYGGQGAFAFSTFVAVCVARCRFISDHVSITPAFLR